MTEIQRKNKKVRKKYGKILQITKRYQESLEQYMQALRIDPENSSNLWNIAFCYQKLEDIDNARLYYLKAIDKDDADNPDTRLLYEYAKMLRNFTTDYKESQKYYLKCLGLCQDDDHAFYNGSYGYLLYLMGEYKEAMKYIKIQLIDESKTNKWPHVYHALYCKAMGDEKDVTVMLWKAAALVTEKEKDYTMSHLQVMIGKEKNASNIAILEKLKHMISIKLSAKCNILCELI